MGTVDAGIVKDLAPAGVLRASINVGNPVLAQGTPEAPGGVTVELARRLAERLGVGVAFVCFDAARKSFEAMVEGRADVCFLAVDPAREAEVAFTAPYVVIEGVFVVRAASGIATVADVDRDGVRVGVKEGSAYDLYLSRTLQNAKVVRGVEGVEVFKADGLEVGGGIRQPVMEFVGSADGLRVIPEAFMEIKQAMGTTKSRAPETVEFLRSFVEEAKASGFVADALARSGRTDAAVAPPA